MSVQSEIDRINSNVQTTLQTIADTGVAVGTNSDALPAAAAALANEKAAAIHAAQHASGGADPITPASIGAVPASEKGVASGIATLAGNGKVTAAQSSAARINVTANRTLTADDAGLLLLCYDAAVTITIPVDTGLPLGMEVEVCRYSTHAVTFVAESGITIRSVDSLTSIANKYGCVCLKKINDTNWLLAGDLG